MPAYLDKESEDRYLHSNVNARWSLFLIKCLLIVLVTVLEYDGRTNAVFSLAGTLGFTSFIESGSDPSLLCFIVQMIPFPYDSGEPFQ
jgi:hypothetical protein